MKLVHACHFFHFVLRLTPTIEICTEHHRSPIGCFSQLTANKASRESYRDTKQYMRCWLPALSMESAVQSVTEGTSARVINVPVRWDVDPSTSKTTAQVTLPTEFCAERFLPFVSHSGETSIKGDYVCIRHRPRGEEPIWVAHCIITSVENPKTDGPDEVTLECQVHQSAQDIPMDLIGEEVDCVVEWIPRPLPLGYFL